MFVKECMETHINSVASDTSVLEADWIMHHKDLPYLLVMDQGKPIGVITRNTIGKRIIQESDNCSVSEFINTILIDKVDKVMESVITVEPDTPIEYAMIIGQEQGVSIFPVMEDEKLIGIATGAGFLSHSSLTHKQKHNTTSNCVLVSCRTSALSDVFDVIRQKGATLISILHSKSPVDGKRRCIVHIEAENVRETIDALNKKGLKPVDLAHELVTP